MPSTPIYDCSVDVKYFAIQRELLETVARCGSTPITTPTPTPSCGYTADSVRDICHTLYQAEMRKVFRQLDTAVDFHIPENDVRVLFTTMMSNPTFERFIVHMCTQSSSTTPQGDRVFTMCFCYDLFYLIHPIICQHLTTGVIMSADIRKLKEEAQIVLATALEMDGIVVGSDRDLEDMGGKHNTPATVGRVGRVGHVGRHGGVPLSNNSTSASNSNHSSNNNNNNNNNNNHGIAIPNLLRI